jgi:hypothetical protein
MKNVILIEELFGKEITDIYAVYGTAQDWLDTAECYLELDTQLIIRIPYSSDKEVWEEVLNLKARTIFAPDKSKLTINKVIMWLLKQPKTEKPELIKNTKIVDFIWYDDSIDKGFILLSNGCLISETTMHPSGTGKAGINFYSSIEELIKIYGNDYKNLKNKAL